MSESATFLQKLRIPRMGRVFWAILALGAFLRLLELGRASYMIDEINVVRDAAAADSLSKIFETELGRFGFLHRLPLTYWVIHLVAGLAKASETGFPPEWLTRLPMALIGIATLPLFFLLGRDLRDRNTGLLAMFLAALSPFHIYYSREAYDYAILIFFSTGVLWSLLALLRKELAGAPLGWKMPVAFCVFLTGLIYAHLAGFLFLAGLGVAMLAAMAVGGALKGLFRVKRLLPWVLMIIVPLLVFSPFLVKMLGGEWVNTDEGSQVNRDWRDVLPGVFGRMGWGQGWFSMIPFVLCVVAGAVWLYRRKGELRHVLVFLVIGAVVYGLIQTWSMRLGRFEVRYFSSLYPYLLVLSALGIAGLADAVSQRTAQMRAHVLVVLAAVLVGCWLAPSAWAVTQLDARGHNYKGLAKWIAENIPDNGIYSYWNVYDGRGVPGVYTTPGRFMAYPTAFSSAEDYKRMQVKERLTALFTKFPTTYFVETAPLDIVDPSRANYDPISRETLFKNRIWLTDPWCDFLIRMQTWPLGLAQWESTWIHKMHISYNTIDDLPEVARNRGMKVFHYFGNDWQYTKDQQMNDWLVTGMSASFYVGSIDGQPMPVNIKLVGAGLPGGCRLSVYGPGSLRLLQDLEIPARMMEIDLPRTMLQAGRNEFVVEILPPANGMQGAFALTDIRISPAQ